MHATEGRVVANLRTRAYHNFHTDHSPEPSTTNPDFVQFQDSPSFPPGVESNPGCHLLTQSVAQPTQPEGLGFISSPSKIDRAYQSTMSIYLSVCPSPFIFENALIGLKFA